MNNRHTILGILVLTIGISALLFWLEAPDVNGIAANSPTNQEPSAPMTGEWARLAMRDNLDSDLVAILRSLQTALEAQQVKQDAMAKELALLRQQMSTSDTGLAMQVDDPLTTSEAAIITPESPGQRYGEIDEKRLVEAGFNLSDARAIAEHLDSIAMERLNLRYEMAREGGINRREYRSSIARLPNTREFLQTTYGDEAYDRYLYAAGRPNRLVVRDVYQGSAAEDVGLLPGDTVLSWDNRRVYSSRDLMTIATDGSSGESVLLTIQRDGARFEVYMPRGPLGITTRQDSVNPAGR